MDLLYSRYASPMELMNIYIEQGRFGEFVSNIFEMDLKRRKEKAEKVNNDRLWLAYIWSMSDKNFNEWKADLQQRPPGHSMNDQQVDKVKQQARNILRKISP